MAHDRRSAGGRFGAQHVVLDPNAPHEVRRIGRCALRVGTASWRFAERHADAIDAHWRRRRAENPGMFNGIIYVLETARLDGDALEGTLMRTDFKSFLYWKDHDYPDRSVRDVFGSALLRSSEGHVLLGRQAAGNLNAGLAYLPGGFIDARDVGDSDQVDIDGSVMREVAEETGLGADLVERDAGYILTAAGPLLSIAVCLRSKLTSEALARAARSHIAQDNHAELADIVVVRRAADVAGLAMPVYASVLLAHLFPKD